MSQEPDLPPNASKSIHEQEEWETVGPLLRHVAILGISILLSTTVVVGFTFSVGVAAGWYYDSHHAIPNPVERGDDLGIGLIVVAASSIAFVVAAPLLPFFTKRIRKILTKHL